MSKDLTLQIEEAKKSASKLGERNAEVKKAEERRDRSLANYLSRILNLRRQAAKLVGETSQKKLLALLRGEFGNDVPKATPQKKLTTFLIELTHPDLTPKMRSKYATVINYAKDHKAKGMKFRDFLKANGGINGCIEKASKVRKRSKKR